MPRPSPFKHHRYPREIILCAIRWYLRYPLSFQDVVDLLAERDVTVDRSTIFRWVQKFGPELTRRTEKHLRLASVDWHADETYIRVGCKWRYLGAPSMPTARWLTFVSPRAVMRRLQGPFSTRPSSVYSCTGLLKL